MEVCWDGSKLLVFNKLSKFGMNSSILISNEKLLLKKPKIFNNSSIILYKTDYFNDIIRWNYKKEAAILTMNGFLTRP